MCRKSFEKKELLNKLRTNKGKIIIIAKQTMCNMQILLQKQTGESIFADFQKQPLAML